MEGFALLFSHGEVAATLGPWGTIAVVASLAALVAFLSGRVLTSLVTYTTKRTRTRIDDIIAASLWPAVGVLIFAVLAWAGVEAFHDYLPEAVVDRWVNIQFLLVTVVIAFSIVRLARSVLEYRVVQKPHLRPMASLGQRGVSLVVWVTAVLVLLRTYDIDINPILTSLGIAGLAVALALQDTLANVFAGIWIQASQSFRPTHFIRIEDMKLDGFIEDIGWRTTRIRTLPGNMIVVPNQTMARSVITDFSLPKPEMGTNLTFNTGLEADPAKVVKIALEEIRAAIQENPAFLIPHPEPFCRLNRVVENGLEFWCSFWTPFYWMQWNAQGVVWMRLLRRFQAEGIRIPYPIRETFAVPPQRGDYQMWMASPPPLTPPQAAEGTAGPPPDPTKL